MQGNRVQLFHAAVKRRAGIGGSWSGRRQWSLNSAGGCRERCCHHRGGWWRRGGRSSEVRLDGGWIIDERLQWGSVISLEVKMDRVNTVRNRIRIIESSRDCAQHSGVEGRRRRGESFCDCQGGHVRQFRGCRRLPPLDRPECFYFLLYRVNLYSSKKKKKTLKFKQ